MTRDEAVKAIWLPDQPQPWAVGRVDAEKIVDRCVALGMLKLDEPPLTREQRIEKVLSAIGPAAQVSDLDYFADLAGLRIVEK